MKKSEALNILGLSDGATEDDIKKAHRSKVRENHPDRFTDPEQKKTAEDKTKLINEARDVLLNHKWDPEYGPRATGYGSPYTSPYTGYRPAGSQTQSSPFDDWQFDYVWTSGTQGQRSQQGQGGAYYGSPFFVDFDSIFTEVPQKSAAEEAAEATRERNTCMAVLGLKLVILAACAFTGNLAAGLWLYALITFIYGLYADASEGCSRMLGVIVLVSVFPAIWITFPRGGSMLSAGTLFWFGIAVVYDFTIIRRIMARYNTAKEKARVSS